jgi:hypothetical protein
MSGTFNKLEVHTNISEKVLQNQVNSVQLFNVQKHSDGDQGDNCNFWIFYISFQRKHTCWKEAYL